MMVLLLDRVPSGLRGELTRWLVEPQRGVFVGRVSARVRDKLWELACDKLKGGGATLLYLAACEQGFAIRTSGSTQRALMDFEGLALFRVEA